MSISNIVQRGLFHIFGGLVICMAALFLPRTALLIALAAITFPFLIFELVRFNQPGINRWFVSFFKSLLREEEALRLTGTSYMLIASLIIFTVFERDIAILSLAFLAVGDATAMMVGMQIGKRRLLGKTLAGDLVCIISCLAIGSIFYFSVISLPFPIIIVGALVGSISEALSLPVNDNLSMPLLAGIAMTLMQNQLYS